MEVPTLCHDDRLKPAGVCRLCLVRLDAQVKPGGLFATFHAAEVFLNQFTSPHRDNVTMAPGYKVVAVSVERISESKDDSVALAISTAGG